MRLSRICIREQEEWRRRKRAWYTRTWDFKLPRRTYMHAQEVHVHTHTLQKSLHCFYYRIHFVKHYRVSGKAKLMPLLSLSCTPSLRTRIRSEAITLISIKLQQSRPSYSAHSTTSWQLETNESLSNAAHASHFFESTEARMIEFPKGEIESILLLLQPKQRWSDPSQSRL